MNTIIVNDQEGLTALPVGTIVTELGQRPCDMTFEIVSPRTVRRIGTGRRHPEVGLGVVCFPALIDNPHILGEFRPVLGKGDIVEIVNGWGGWPGVQGAVIDFDHDRRPYIQPHADRPDRFGRSPFYWNTEDVRLVRTAAEEAERVAAEEARKAQPTAAGQRVEVVSGEGSPRTEVGDLGTVVRVYESVLSNTLFAEVDLDKGGRNVNVFTRRLKVVDTPKPLAVGDLVTSEAQLDALPALSAVVSGGTVNTKMEDGEFARFNVFATAAKIGKLRDGNHPGMVYGQERRYIEADIRSGNEVKVVHVAN